MGPADPIHDAQRVGALPGDGGLLTYLEIASWAYEVVVLIGALIFVALLRRFRLFGPEEWPAGKGARAKAAGVR